MEQIQMSQQQTPLSATSSQALLQHPDIVQIHERFECKMANMQRQVVAMIQDIYGFLADEIALVTVKMLTAQQQQQQQQQTRKPSEQNCLVRTTTRAETTSNVSSPQIGINAINRKVTMPTDHNNITLNSMETTPQIAAKPTYGDANVDHNRRNNNNIAGDCTRTNQSQQQQLRIAVKPEIMEIEIDTSRFGTIVEQQPQQIELTASFFDDTNLHYRPDGNSGEDQRSIEDVSVDQQNEIIKYENDNQMDHYCCIEIDDDEDSENENGNEDNEMNAINENYEKPSYGIETISIRCDINRCEYMADEKQIIYHKRETHGVRRYQCRICDPIISFDKSKHLCDHIKLTHSRATDFRCDQCSRTFRTHRAYKKHKYRYHETGIFRCMAHDCAFERTIRQQLFQHIRHEHRRHVCTFAGCENSTSCNHAIQHNPAQLFACAFSADCDYTAQFRSNLVTHIRMVHFKLPKTVKQQLELNIVDTRDPNQYVRVQCE